MKTLSQIRCKIIEKISEIKWSFVIIRIVIFLSVIHVYANPVADFTATVVTGCSPLRVNFINKSTGAIQYKWNLGNGNTSNLVNPAGLYTQAGKYTVSLIATDSLGISDTLVLNQYIEVYQIPEVKINYNRKSACVGDTLELDCALQAGQEKIVKYSWDVGTGDIYSGKKVQFRVSKPGDYNITLAVEDARGCRSSVSQPQAFTIYNNPWVLFSSNTQARCKAPANIEFKSQTNSNGIIKYAWDFGDSTYAAEPNPVKLYNRMGNFNVQLTVTNLHGCKHTYLQPDFIQIHPPIVKYSTSQAGACSGKSISFVSDVQPQGGQYLWDFGDGSEFSTLQNPDKKYAQSGEFLPKLSYTWEGCSSFFVASAPLMILPAPKVKINLQDTTVCRMLGKGLKMTATAQNYQHLKWIDGRNYARKNDSLSSYIFRIDSSATYKIKLIASSYEGCETAADSVQVIVRGPKASYVITEPMGCIPYKSKAGSTSTSIGSSIVSYAWESTQLGIKSNAKSFQFTNNYFGNSYLYLTVTDANGCIDKTGKQLGGGKKYKADFDIWKKEICNNEPLMVTNRSAQKSKDSVLAFWNWNGKDTIPFRSGDSGIIRFRTQPNPRQRITFSNISFGCSSSDTFYVKVNGPLLEGSTRIFCDQDSISGQNKSSFETKTWWQYSTQNIPKNWIENRTLSLPLTGTKTLWLHAINDSSGCKDSLQFKINPDSQVAQFTYTLDCKTAAFHAENLYKGLKDTQFVWTIQNQSRKTIQVLKQRHIENLILTSGKYTVTLAVFNPKFNCTKSDTRYFTVADTASAKPRVEVGDELCSGISMQLVDEDWAVWKSAIWMVDNQQIIKDSAFKINYLYTGNKHQIEIKITRSTDANCTYTDSFIVQGGGPAAEIRFYNQYNQDCLHPVVSFGGHVKNQNPNRKYQYSWDFGYRKSNEKTDTIAFQSRKSVEVKLIITDDKGCIGSTSSTFVARAGKPQARFRVLADTLISCPPLQFAVVDSSISPDFPIVSRLWNFGDETFSDKLNASKIYAVPGDYTVSLIVTNSIGCADTQVLQNLVHVRGPKGILTLSKSTGCSPLNLQLGVFKGQGIAKITYDFGDGYVTENLRDSAHIYLQAGRFIPRLMMEDAAGCKYSPTAKDTIQVYAKPEVFLSNETVCANKPVITAMAFTSADKFRQINWTVNGVKAGYGYSVKWTPKPAQNNPVSVRVETVHGCTDTAFANYRTMGIQARLTVPKNEFCLGNKIQFNDHSKADTLIVKRSLVINGKTINIAQGLHYMANTRGILPVYYEITDAIGCADTFSDMGLLKVGDTLPPAAQIIYSSTVVNAEATQTRFEMSKEPDFKDMSLYIFKNGNWCLAASSSMRSDTNLFVGGLNTNFNSYCHKITQRNFCGISTNPVLIKEHCTIHTRAAGDTNVARVSWTPYIGWNRVEKYKIWRKEKGKNNFEFIASTNGNLNTFVDSAITCHVEYDYYVEGIEEGGNLAASESNSAHAIPIHYLPVPAPEIITTTVENNALIITQFEAVQNHRIPVSTYSIYRENEGNTLLVNTIQAGETPSWEDKTADFKHQNYTYYVQAIDVCHTQSPMSNAGRNIVLAATTAENGEDAVLNWTAYFDWKQGVENYRIERSYSGGEFVEIGMVDGNTLQFMDKNIPATCIENLQYRIVAIRKNTGTADNKAWVISVSNQVQFVPEIKFYIPNAFTPDENNLNEKFAPNGKYFTSYEMRIYNRWGQKIYEGNGCQNQWDGRFGGELVQDGVYAYEIIARDFSGKEYNFNGTVTILK